MKHQNYITFWVTIKLTTHNKSNVCVMYDLKLPVQLFGSNFSLLKQGEHQFSRMLENLMGHLEGLWCY